MAWMVDIYELKVPIGITRREILFIYDLEVELRKMVGYGCST